MVRIGFELGLEDGLEVGIGMDLRLGDISRDRECRFLPGVDTPACGYQGMIRFSAHNSGGYNLNHVTSRHVTRITTISIHITNTLTAYSNHITSTHCICTYLSLEPFQFTINLFTV